MLRAHVENYIFLSVCFIKFHILLRKVMFTNSEYYGINITFGNKDYKQ